MQVVPASHKVRIMQEVHGNVVGGGHFGRDKTLAKLAERYYWVGMSADVRYFCRTCDQCQRANRYKMCLLKDKDEFGNVFFFLHTRKFDKYTAELHPIPVLPKVWHTVGVDLIGPLPQTAR